MTRFSSQRTRQVRLKMGTVLDSFLYPETLELFDQNGDPINLDASPFPPGGSSGQVLAKRTSADGDIQWQDLPEPPEVTEPPPGPAPGTMIWKGAWDPYTEYHTNDVVQYDDGSGSHTYIFVQDGPAPEGDQVPDFQGQPITAYFDPATAPLEVTIDGTSPRAFLRGTPDSAYAAIAFKTVDDGALSIRTEPVEGGNRDMYASLWALVPGGTWEYKTFNDDSAGLSHPELTYSTTANTYVFAFTTYYGGAQGDTAYGTSRIFLGNSNDVTVTAFNLGGPIEFPMDAVMQIG